MRRGHETHLISNEAENNYTPTVFNIYLKLCHPKLYDTLYTLQQTKESMRLTAGREAMIVLWNQSFNAITGLNLFGMSHA